MRYEKVFVSLMDFFSILVPGALAHPIVPGDHYTKRDDTRCSAFSCSRAISSAT